MYIYSDPTRESDPHALPNVEVFDDFTAECSECGQCWPDDGSVEAQPCECGGRFQRKGDSPGWFYAFGFPGCLWDSDPVGPFDSEDAAIADMLESAA